MISTRVLFPYVYAAFALPLVFGEPWLVVLVGLSCLILAGALNPALLRGLLPLIVTSLVTFLVLLSLIQTAVCTSPARHDQASLAVCLLGRIVPTFLTVTSLTSIMVLASCHEWRSTLTETINGLFLPRRLRIMSVVAVAMVGEFRKAFLRVHHAATARGDASPAARLGNLKALPRILACAWASVLKTASERIEGQWSSAAFWNTYVPATGPFARRGGRDTIVILAAAIGVVAALALAGNG